MKNRINSEEEFERRKKLLEDEREKEFNDTRREIKSRTITGLIDIGGITGEIIDFFDSSKE